MTSLPMADEPCSGCGECCARMDRPPFFVTLRPDTLEPIAVCSDGSRMDASPDFQRWLDLPMEMKEEIDRDRRDKSRPDESPCLWWDQQTKRCRHYELRPEVCRQFQPGERACNRMRKDIGLPPLPEVPSLMGDDDE